MSILTSSGGGEEGALGCGEGDAPGREAFQLGRGSEALGRDGTCANSAMRPVHKLCALCSLSFPAVCRAAQSVSRNSTQGQEDSCRNQLPPHSAPPCWGMFFHYSLLNC